MALLDKIGSAAIPRWAKVGIPVALLLLLAGLLLGRCSRDDTAKQAEQTSASSDAIADAASAAISTMGNRTASDASIDAAVASASKDIDNATDSRAVRNAVLASVCGKASHRHDPACAVR